MLSDGYATTLPISRKVKWKVHGQVRQTWFVSTISYELRRSQLWISDLKTCACNNHGHKSQTPRPSVLRKNTSCGLKLQRFTAAKCNGTNTSYYCANSNSFNTGRLLHAVVMTGTYSSHDTHVKQARRFVISFEHQNCQKEENIYNQGNEFKVQPSQMASI